jgi:hypothetical protein
MERWSLTCRGQWSPLLRLLQNAINYYKFLVLWTLLLTPKLSLWTFLLFFIHRPLTIVIAPLIFKLWYSTKLKNMYILVKDFSEDIMYRLTTRRTRWALASIKSRLTLILTPCRCLFSQWWWSLCCLSLLSWSIIHFTKRKSKKVERLHLSKIIRISWMN